METAHDNGETKLETWEAPVIRTVVPVDRTQGGPFAKNDQDNAFYKTS